MICAFKAHIKTWISLLKIYYLEIVLPVWLVTAQEMTFRDSRIESVQQTTILTRIRFVQILCVIKLCQMSLTVKPAAETTRTLTINLYWLSSYYLCGYPCHLVVKLLTTFICILLVTVMSVTTVNLRFDITLRSFLKVWKGQKRFFSSDKMSSADVITSTSDKIVLHTLNCGGTFSYPGTGNVEISFPVKSRPKIIGDIITRPYLADEILTCKYDPRNGFSDQKLKVYQSGHPLWKD